MGCGGAVVYFGSYLWVNEMVKRRLMNLIDVSESTEV